MKRALMLVIALAFVAPCITTFTGCDTPTAQEKEWEKDIPKVPPGDKKSKMPPSGEQPK